MHKCTGNIRTCPGCRREAAKIISDWGCEGVHSAARIVGEDTAQGMLKTHVRRNVERAFPKGRPSKVEELVRELAED